MVENRVWRKEGIDGRLFAPSAGGYPDDKIFVDKDNSLGGGAGRWYRRYYNVTETVTVSIECVADSWIDAGGPNDNHGSDTKLWSRGSAGGERRCIMRYDLAEVEGGVRDIPDDAWIISAQLNYIISDQAPYNLFSAWGCDDGWDESTVTWNNKPGVHTDWGKLTDDLNGSPGQNFRDLNVNYIRWKWAINKLVSLQVIPWYSDNYQMGIESKELSWSAINVTWARERLYNIDVGVTGALRSR